MSSQKNVVTLSASASRLIGRVKWFNNKAGYGFVTVTDGERSGTDIFVHHSAISVESQQYKYLVQGEYIEFSEVAATSGPHQYQATNILGVKGGKLMCETRRDFKIARSNYKSTKGENDQEPHLEVQEVREPRQKSVPRLYGEGPRDRSRNTPTDSDKKEWTLVQKGSDKSKPVARVPRKPPIVVSN